MPRAQPCPPVHSSCSCSPRPGIGHRTRGLTHPRTLPCCLLSPCPGSGAWHCPQFLWFCDSLRILYTRQCPLPPAPTACLPGCPHSPTSPQGQPQKVQHHSAGPRMPHTALHWPTQLRMTPNAPQSPTVLCTGPELPRGLWLFTRVLPSPAPRTLQSPRGASARSLWGCPGPLGPHSRLESSF